VVNPVLIVDAANVVGSVPDGWWRDRRGATIRLRDALVPIAANGLGPLDPASVSVPRGPADVVLVVEGAASGLESVPGVRVVSAPWSGDDQIVTEAEAAVREGRTVYVVTADRGLRSRVTAVGARVLGPRTVPRS
jgi:hypothetical protein